MLCILLNHLYAPLPACQRGSAHFVDTTFVNPVKSEKAIVTSVIECHCGFVTLKPKLDAGLRGIVTNVTAFRGVRVAFSRFTLVAVFLVCYSRLFYLTHLHPVVYNGFSAIHCRGHGFGNGRQRFDYGD